MVFRDIFPNIICTWSPVDHELVMVGPVSDPAKSHVNGLTALLFHCAF